MLFDLELRPPPLLLPELDCRPGRVVTVAKPVVLRASCSEVVVMITTDPSDPVEVNTLDIRRVDVATRADVMVVSSVVLSEDDSDPDVEVAAEEPGGGVDDGGSVVVMMVDSVVGVLMVVGVPFDVAVVTVVRVVALVVVEVSDWAEEVGSVVADVGSAGVDETPVPT
jgi:hypothetical protein